MSDKYRDFFFDNIPSSLCIKGSSECLYTKNGTLLSNGYKRIVIGDYGAFIEIEESQMNLDILQIKKGQEYRVSDKNYCDIVKYNWLTIDDSSNIKVYLQKKKVSYADYLIGMYYVSPHEVEVKI